MTHGQDSLVLPNHHPAPLSLLDRRSFVIGAGAAGMALGTGIGVAYTRIAAEPDYTLRIARAGQGDRDLCV
jgi:hypothetical protein